MKTLVIDIGNTHTVLGLFEDQKLHRSWRMNTEKSATSDELSLWLHHLPLELTGPDKPLCAVANVVPAVSWAWRKLLEHEFHLRTHFLDSSNCPKIKIDYKYPEQVGADRLANVLGCMALGISEAIVIDFGTATTFDIYARNTYFGGLIQPGILTSLTHLIAKTSRLSDVSLHWNPKIVGKTTDDALCNGILYGVRGQIKFCTEAIAQELKLERPLIIATGGLAPLVAKGCPEIDRLERDLTLQGLNYFSTLLEEQK